MDEQNIEIVPEIDLMGEARALRGKIEAALKKEMQEAAQQSMLGLFLSIGGFLIFGGILYMFVAWALIKMDMTGPGKFPFGLFFLIYIIVFAGLVVLSEKYEPQKEYYLGKGFAGQTYDDPFTLRDNMDRRHMALGFLLVVPNFFRMNMKNIFDYWNSNSPVTNSTLTAAILAFVKQPQCNADIFDAMRELRFSGNSISQTLGYLRLINWIETKEDNGRNYVFLTEKVKDILFY